VWGTNGLPWAENLKQLDELGLKDEVKRKLIRDNAVALFKLDTASQLQAASGALS